MADQTNPSALRSRRRMIGAPPPIQVPRAELVNVLEYEAQARQVLGPARAALVAGSDRSITDRITLRPRMNIPTRDLDLTSTLFGDQHFAPIIVGPVADQKRFHPEGEVAMARGASAAKAAMVVSSGSDLTTIAPAATAPLYLQVAAGSLPIKDRLALAPNAKAVFVTVGPHIDWAVVDAAIRAVALPVIVKGITRPQDAREAAARGAKGVVVSNWQGAGASTQPAPLLQIAPVVQAVGDRIPVLADGGFRRGTDIVKALAFGAKAVLVARPVIWGLAAYGADGVQGVMEMLQTELARYMCMCGRPTLAAVDSSLVRVHSPLPAEKHHG